MVVLGIPQLANRCILGLLVLGVAMVTKIALPCRCFDKEGDFSEDAYLGIGFVCVSSLALPPYDDRLTNLLAHAFEPPKTRSRLLI
jgi:hypothetical protein